MFKKENWPCARNKADHTHPEKQREKFSKKKKEKGKKIVWFTQLATSHDGLVPFYFFLI